MNALQEGDVTLPSLLQAAGYTTIHAGKQEIRFADGYADVPGKVQPLSLQGQMLTL